jgi:cobaltochelatase CobS
MSYNPQTVAAAIATLGDRAMTEQNVTYSDSDALGRIMVETEDLVARQLARAGMALIEARELAAQAAVMTGRETDESNALADLAYTNRHAEVPEPAAQAPHEEIAITVAAGAQTDEVVEPASGAALIETHVTGAPAASVEVASAPTPARRQAFAVPSRVAPEPKQRRHTVVMKKVHEVFAGVDASEAAFNFELPMVNWSDPHPKVPTLDAAYAFDPADLHTILYAIAENSSLNLVGPHGCGKTQAVAQVAARLNFPLITLPMDGQMSRNHMIGQEKLRVTEFGTESYFSEGELTQALAEPGFILFDEVDRAVSDLQYACHSVYLGEGLKLLEDAGRYIPQHRYNRVFATANTKGRGSMDGMYQAAEEMSEATRDRWSLWVDMDYPEADADHAVLMRKNPALLDEHATIISGIAAEIRTAYKLSKLSQTCSMRNQLEVAKKCVFLCRGERDDVRRRKALRHAFERVILGRASPEDKIAIENFIKIKMPDAFTGASFF